MMRVHAWAAGCANSPNFLLSWGHLCSSQKSKQSTSPNPFNLSVSISYWGNYSVDCGCSLGLSSPGFTHQQGAKLIKYSCQNWLKSQRTRSKTYLMTFEKNGKWPKWFELFCLSLDSLGGRHNVPFKGVGPMFLKNASEYQHRSVSPQIHQNHFSS